MSEYRKVCRVEASLIEYAKNSSLLENTTNLMQPIKEIHEKIEKRHGEIIEESKPEVIDVKVIRLDEDF